jgi:hypothetical protein
MRRRRDGPLGHTDDLFPGQVPDGDPGQFSRKPGRCAQHLGEASDRTTIRSPAVPHPAAVLLELTSFQEDPPPLSAGSEGRQVLRRFLLARHQWLTTLLTGWPPAERREFARLICRFTGDIDRHLGELSR